MKLAERIAWMKPSATLAINARAKELRSQGVDVLSFAAGEPDFETPEHVRRAATEALEQGHTRYTAVPGDPELRAEVAREFSASRGCEVTSANVVVGCGAKQPLAHFFHAVLDPGDEVLLPAPCWVSYPSQIRIAAGVPVFAETDPDRGFRLEVDAFRAALTPRTRALVLNAPCNPTGAGYDRASLAALAEVVLERDLWVVSDEVYRRITFDGFVQESIVTVAPQISERCLVVDGVSKTYSMTGWRIGWGIGPEPLVSAISKLQGQLTSCAPAFGQRAALAALRGDQEALSGWLADLETRRDAIVEGLSSIPGVRCSLPLGTFYVMADVRELLGKSPPSGEPLGDTVAVASYLLDEAKVAAVPGEPFHGPGYIRFSFACSMETVREGVRRVGEALSRLK